MSFTVVRVESLGMPRNHHALFVQTNEARDGVKFHVTGNILNGMQFEMLDAQRPETWTTFIKQTILGTVLKSDLNQVESVCRRVPPPKKQFHGPRRIYPGEPLRRCQEWTHEVVDELVAGGVLVLQVADGGEGHERIEEQMG